MFFFCQRHNFDPPIIFYYVLAKTQFQFFSDPQKKTQTSLKTLCFCSGVDPGVEKTIFLYLFRLQTSYRDDLWYIQCKQRLRRKNIFPTSEFFFRAPNIFYCNSLSVFFGYGDMKSRKNREQRVSETLFSATSISRRFMLST